MSKGERSKLFNTYQNLKQRYLRNKELATCLIGGIIGANWRADVEKFTLLSMNTKEVTEKMQSLWRQYDSREDLL